MINFVKVMDKKILKLTLNRKWFEMIFCNIKKEEYREIKKHWNSRLLDKESGEFRDYTHVEFTNGYSSDSPKMVVECLGIEIGTGNAYWGAEEGVEYYVIKLGEIVESSNVISYI